MAASLGPVVEIYGYVYEQARMGYKAYSWAFTVAVEKLDTIHRHKGGDQRTCDDGGLAAECLVMSILQYVKWNPSVRRWKINLDNNMWEVGLNKKLSEADVRVLMEDPHVNPFVIVEQVVDGNVLMAPSLLWRSPGIIRCIAEVSVHRTIEWCEGQTYEDAEAEACRLAYPGFEYPMRLEED